jgi:hypothetical protein
MPRPAGRQLAEHHRPSRRTRAERWHPRPSAKQASIAVAHWPATRQTHARVLARSLLTVGPMQESTQNRNGYWIHEPAATSPAERSGTVASALGRRPAQAAVPAAPLVRRRCRSYGVGMQMGLGLRALAPFSSQGVGAMHVVTVRLRSQPVRGPGVLMLRDQAIPARRLRLTAWGRGGGRRGPRSARWRSVRGQDRWRRP